MTVTIADIIFGGLISGIIATAAMTVSKIPSWKKWGCWAYLNGMKTKYSLPDFSVLQGIN